MGELKRRGARLIRNSVGHVRPVCVAGAAEKERTELIDVSIITCSCSERCIFTVFRMSSSLVLHHVGNSAQFLACAPRRLKGAKSMPSPLGSIGGCPPHFYLWLIMALDDLRGEVLKAEGRVERRLDGIEVRRQGRHAPRLRASRAPHARQTREM